MTAPVISALPVAPSRTDAPATFVTEADAFVAALATFRAEMNAVASYLDALVGTGGSLDPELLAIAGLTSAADKLPYFTGSATASLANFTALARTLLACSTQAAMRSAIGAGSGTGDVISTNNLSDLASAPAARTNLGLLRLVSFFFTTTPTASEVLALYVAADAFTLPANLSGSKVNVGTNATATFALDLQQNGTTIGTISIATSGTATLTTTSGTAKSVAVGDVLKVVAPATPDATIANVAINIKGTL